MVRKASAARGAPVTLPPPKCLLAPYIWKPLTGGYYRGFSQLESIEPSRFSLYTHFTAFLFQSVLCRPAFRIDYSLASPPPRVI
jgi:hypothetical protein